MANGKICYIEMPAVDVARSADFYERGDGSTAFGHTTGQVSRTWELNRRHPRLRACNRSAQMRPRSRRGSATPVGTSSASISNPADI
jgi:hypothetical protein